MLHLSYHKFYSHQVNEYAAINGDLPSRPGSPINAILAQISNPGTPQGVPVSQSTPTTTPAPQTGTFLLPFFPFIWASKWLVIYISILS